MTSVETQIGWRFDTIGSMREGLRTRAQAVAAIAATQADAVDREGRFPAASIEAAKQHGLMSLLVPLDCGGEGVALGDVADVCYTLGTACAATGMIVAMHQAALACVARHHGGSAWHTHFLRQVAAKQLLLASSTTEGFGGGNVRSSAAALQRDGDVLRFERAATVMSYGAQADGIVTVARRSPDAAASDQVLVPFLKADYRLEATGGWDTLGMRGTCSAGFALDATGTAAQVMPIGYDKIHAQTMVPVSHLVWAGVWTGIAAAAVARAQMFVRTAARRAKGQMPPGAPAFTKAVASLNSLRNMVAAAVARFESMADDERALMALDTQTALNLFKVEASELAVTTVTQAMRACGLSGYRNDGEFGMGRHLRDVLSAPIMVHNERILSSITTAATMSTIAGSLRD